jgi:glucosylceramidase
LGLTVQNEPMAKQTWESCIYTAEEERDFVKLFRSNKMLDLETKKLLFGIIIESYLRGRTIWTTHKLVNVWGIGFHWYESWSGGDPMFDNVGKVHEMYPDKTCFLLE